MILEKIRIRNFCSCNALDIDLNTFNPIIGYNNSGKSNILRAINWLLKKSVLQASSFYDQNQAVIVEGVISDVNVNILPVHQQQQVAAYIANGKLEFRRRQDIPTATAAQIRIEVLDPNTGNWRNNPVGLDNAIGLLFPDAIYIEAMDDAADDVARFSAKNTIGMLLKCFLEGVQQQNVQAFQAIQNALQTVNDSLNGPQKIQQLTDLETAGNQELSAFFPGLSLQISINTPLFEDLVKGASLNLSDNQQHVRAFSSFGHGTQRSVQMALIKLLADQINHAQANLATKILLIDEPELYLHPQAIEILRDALKQLSAQNFQVIFSTHSPLLIGKDDVLDTSMIFKNQGVTTVRPKLSQAAHVLAQNPHQMGVIFSLQHSTYLLFSERILVVEGKTEKMIFPDLFEVASGRSLGLAKACLIDVGSSSSIYPTMQVLHNVGFQPKAIVDLDFIFKVAPQIGLIQTTDPNFVACHQWFIQNHAANQFLVGADGFPTRRNGTQYSTVLPERAFELLAAAMPNQISQLSGLLRQQNIWVWDKGAIELHLGIPRKDDAARMAFLALMKARGNLNHAAFPQDIRDCVNWIL
ncbi:AAA family ATPase [Herbaspirillum sp. WGmk3]|uniref:ATP-dependent nuclease n=1 Tax=Herbaspirillum sp. WGmk3 TaxID=2919925 RepID=UPI002090D94B|nr:AAA family ATPase [Herbaspirillum sp. WGmk3]MCO4854905.1 AAA family ATPase [Herbaspirillum sp. WGmk3]